MKRLWLALWFMVLGFDALQPQIEGPSWQLAVISLTAAGLLLLGRTGGPWFDRRLAGTMAAVSCIVAFLLPWPENLGSILLAIGMACAAAPFTDTRAHGNIWRVPASLGALLSLLSGAAHLYRLFEAHVHDLDFLARPVALAYRVLGVEAAADPPFVHLSGVGVLHTFDCSTEKFLGFALFLFGVAGMAVLFMLHGRRLGWKRPLALLASVVTFAFLRLLVLGLVLDDNPDPSIYYLRHWIFGGLLVLVLFLMATFRPRVSAPETTTGRPSALGMALLLRRFPLLAVLSTVVLGLCSAGGLGWYEPGHLKAGRILIDEKHSNWEWSTIELTTESYGVQTVYNYSELVRYLGHFYEIAANFETLTDSLLETTDVLILKTPTRPYADDEVAAILRFVEMGGGLWLIGDHTNVFGMSTNLNKVARHFGMRYRFDAVIDLLTHGRQFFERPRRFAHPSIRHLPGMLMATSSSMVGPALGQPVMVGRSLLSDELDYSVNTFFGDFLPEPSEPFGCMLQAIAVTHGKGRVLGFSDSTIFSNFFMFIRGKPELALGSVQWLMHENQFAWIRSAFFVLAMLSLVMLVALSPRVPRQVVAVGLLLGLLAFAAMARGLDSWIANWSQLPQPKKPLPLVAFDRGRTAYQIPDLQEIPERSPSSYHTFYVWTQRVGYIPTTRLFEKCLENSEIIVLINPRDHFAADEIQQLKSYVWGGGRLLVMDSAHARHSTANTLLQPFGLSFNYAEMESVAVHDAATGDSVATLLHIGEVVGGEPVLLLPDGRIALSYVDEGEGRVVAFCASENFNDATLGTTSEVPSAEQLALYRLQFRIFGDLLRREQQLPEGGPNTAPD